MKFPLILNITCNDEDGIKNWPQRAGGCCEPVPKLKTPSPSELAAENLSRLARLKPLLFFEAAAIFAAKEGGTTLLHVPHNTTTMSVLWGIFLF